MMRLAIVESFEFEIGRFCLFFAVRFFLAGPCVFSWLDSAVGSIEEILQPHNFWSIPE
jgi:hypothetical protein